eukprot:3939270-Rhodomonas_salina.1
MQYRLCESADDMMALMLQKWDSPDTGHPPIKYSGSIVGKFRAVRKLSTEELKQNRARFKRIGAEFGERCGADFIEGLAYAKDSYVLCEGQVTLPLSAYAPPVRRAMWGTEIGEVSGRWWTRQRRCGVSAGARPYSPYSPYCTVL